MPEMLPVDSSWIAAIGYDASSEETFVELIEGGLYVYMSVPPVIWRAFINVDSKGTFVNEVLKPQYRFRNA